MLTGIGENLNEMTSPLFAADDWLNKPFDFADLDARIRETLAQARPGAAARRRRDEAAEAAARSGAAHPPEAKRAARKPAAKKAAPKKAAPKKAAPKKAAPKKPAAKKLAKGKAPAAPKKRAARKAGAVAPHEAEHAGDPFGARGVTDRAPPGNSSASARVRFTGARRSPARGTFGREVRQQLQ